MGTVHGHNCVHRCGSIVMGSIMGCCIICHQMGTSWCSHMSTSCFLDAASAGLAQIDFHSHSTKWGKANRPNVPSFVYHFLNRHVSNHPIKSFYYVNNCQLMEKKSFLKKVTKVTHISRQGTRQGGRMTQISWEFEGTVEKESWRKEACMHMAMGSRRWQRGMPH